MTLTEGQFKRIEHLFPTPRGNVKIDAPNRLSVADVSYVSTGEGALFLAVFQGVFSRRIVGW